MDQFNMQLKQLERLQRKSKKSAAKLNKIARKKMNDLSKFDMMQWGGNFPRSMRRSCCPWRKNLPAVRMPNVHMPQVQMPQVAMPQFEQLPIKKTVSRFKGVAKGLFIGLAVLGVVAGVTALLFKKYKEKRQNVNDESRFDLINDVGDIKKDDFDFDNASLEELEDAMLRVENGLDAIEDKKIDQE